MGDQKMSCNPFNFRIIPPALLAGVFGVGLGLQTGALSADSSDLVPARSRFILSALLFPLSRIACCMISSLVGLSKYRLIVAGISGAVTGCVLGFMGVESQHQPVYGSITFAVLAIVSETYSYP